jgi:hypothetical protein
VVSFIIKLSFVLIIIIIDAPELPPYTMPEIDVLGLKFHMTVPTDAEQEWASGDSFTSIKTIF